MKAYDVSTTGGGIPTPPVVADEPRRLVRSNDADYEASQGMEPLADIHAERDLVAGRYAELRPLHGPAKMWDHRRKAILSLIELDLRRGWGEDGATKGLKLTEGAVDAAAHNDPRYVAFLDAGVDTAIEYEGLSVRMSNLEERSARGQVLGRLRASEMHMQPQGA